MLGKARHTGAARFPSRTERLACAVIMSNEEIIRLAATAWGRLTLSDQAFVWIRLVEVVNGDRPVANDRPDLRRQAESIFRQRIEKAFGNGSLLREFAEDCPFWPMGRDELLQQNATELRRWYRLLKPRKGQAVPEHYLLFVRALRHAAGLLEATGDSEP